MVPLEWYLFLSLGLFFIGLFSFLTRKNILMIFLSIEIMLNGINISLITISHYMQDIHGQIIAFFVIANAAAGVAIGLTLVIAAFRNKPTLNLEDLNILKG